MRTAHPGARRIAAVLVFEFARQHENFFAAEMAVRLKAFAGRPFHQRHMLAFEQVPAP